MRKSMRVKHFVAPALLTLAALGLGSGCSSAKNALGGGTCGGADSGINASLTAMTKAVADLQALEADVTGSVALACASIAKDLGSSTADPTKFKAGTKASKDDINTACDDAKAQLNTALTAAGSGSVTVSVIAPSCTADVSAQLDCQAHCNAQVNCSPPDVTAQCEPGHLSVSCSGSCTGKCTANVSAACTGTCNGTCSGNCTGQAASGTGTATTANGQCNGTCDGTCQGSCTADASGSCTGSCSGSCSGEATAPSCDVALTPPKCDAAADCNAGCDGSASAKLVCTKPSVSVTVTGSASATLKTTLEANLPVLVQVAAKGKVAATTITGIASTAADVGAQLTAEGLACASAAANFGGQVTAAAEASANVSVSFSASASVSGTATGSTS